MRTCSRCGENKPLETGFSHNKNGRDGYDAACKTCRNAYAKQWYQRNQEKARKDALDRYHADPKAANERSRKWRAANPDRHRENNRRWREANAEQHCANARRWAVENSTAYRERLKRWREQNPDKVKAYRENDREALALRERRRRAALGTPTPETSAYVSVLTEDPCAYCGSRETLQIDHIEPVARGGDPDWTNLTVACRSCNSSKNAEPLLAWLLAQAP